MPIKHKVRQGESIPSIAFDNGLAAETIWEHANIRELKDKRKDPNILMPDDVVFVPDKRLKEVSEATNQVYKYKCKNTPVMLKLQLLKEGQPRSSEAYELEIDGLKFSGSTDQDGRIEHSVPPNSKRGELSLRNGEEKYEIEVGHLNPLDETTGAQGRLRHLGFYFGPIDGAVSEEFGHALQLFQVSRDLEPNGELDDATRNALKEGYGN